MKLDSLLAQLEQLRISVEAGDYADYSEGYVGKVILQKLIEFTGNKKIQEKVDEIPF